MEEIYRGASIVTLLWMLDKMCPNWDQKRPLDLKKDITYSVKHMHKTSFKNWSTNSLELEFIPIFAQYSIQIVAVWSKSFFFGESQKVSAFCHFSLQPLVSSFLFKSIIYPFTSTWFQQEIFIFHIQADVTWCCTITISKYISVHVH